MGAVEELKLVRLTPALERAFREMAMRWHLPRVVTDLRSEAD